MFGDSGTIVGFFIVGAKVSKPLSRICGVILLLLFGVTANAAAGGQGDGRAVALPTKKGNRETLFCQLPCLATRGVLPFIHIDEPKWKPGLPPSGGKTTVHPTEAWLQARDRGEKGGAVGRGRG